MDACQAVEREVDKVLAKFKGYSQHTAKALDELSSHIQGLKSELEECKLWTQIVLRKPTKNLGYCDTVLNLFENKAKVGQLIAHCIPDLISGVRV